MASDPLPSWRDREAKRALLKFIDDVTGRSGEKYIEPSERVAVFDNDGTLWTEKPVYSQVFFLFERVKELATQHPEWRDQQPFKSILEQGLEALKSLTEPDAAKLLASTHAGMTEDEFESSVARFLRSFRHPETRRLLTESVYRPMVELIELLKEKEFKVFIVTGGGVEFVRSFAEQAYGVSRENVIGSELQYEYVPNGESPLMFRKPELVPPVDEGAGKPVHIQRAIGRRPILAFGNSDGDMEMLRFATAAPGERLGLILHHDDEDREFRYDRRSKVGHLEKALDEAPHYRWMVVSMKEDFKTVY